MYDVVQKLQEKIMKSVTLAAKNINKNSKRFHIKGAKNPFDNVYFPEAKGFVVVPRNYQPLQWPKFDNLEDAVEHAQHMEGYLDEIEESFKS